MNTPDDIPIACAWTCARCGHHGVFHQKPAWGDERYVLAEESLCFECYRRVYAEAVKRWASPWDGIANAVGVVTAPGRGLLAGDIANLLDDPNRSILTLAVSVAHVVVARGVVDTLQLTFDLGGVPQDVIVGAPLPYSFVRDLAAVVATDFAPLQRKARG